MSTIRAFVLDVDGVLTDDTFLWGPADEEWKRFSFADVMGISRARRAGYLFALVSGENSPLVDRFATKLGITDVFKDCKDKAHALLTFAARHGISLSAIVFMGNDLNDLEAMSRAGIAAAPSNAAPQAKATASVVTQLPGGHGAVRELLGLLTPEVFTPDPPPSHPRPR